MLILTVGYRNDSHKDENEILRMKFFIEIILVKNNRFGKYCIIAY